MSKEHNESVQGWKKEIDDTLRIFALAPLFSLDGTVPEAVLPIAQYKLLENLQEKVHATGNSEIITYYESEIDKMKQASEEIQADIKRGHEQYWKEMLEKYPKSAEYTGEEKERVFEIRDDIEGVFKRAKFLARRYFDEPPMKLTCEEVINLIQSRIGALEGKVQVVDDPWLTDCFKEKNTAFSSEWMQKLYQKNLVEKHHIGVKENTSEMSDELVSMPNLAKPQPQKNKTFGGDVLVVFQKMKNLFEFKSKNYKGPVTETIHLDFVGVNTSKMLIAYSELLILQKTFLQRLSNYTLLILSLKRNQEKIDSYL